MARSKFHYAKDVLPAREELVKRFPLAFSAKGELATKPLKIGIFEDIVQRAPDISSALLRAVIGDYTSGPKYARCMVAGAARVDLDGLPSGHVTPQQEAYSQGRERARRRRILQRQQQRTAQPEREAA